MSDAMDNIHTAVQKEIDPAYIERLITETGRERVFARARELGWHDGGAPLWVWQQICVDVRAATLAKD